MIDDKTLRVIVSQAIADANNRPSTFTKKIKEMMSSDFNVSPGETADILNGRNPVEAMTYEMLFKVASVLHKLNLNLDDGFPVNKLNVDFYFTKEEIKKFSKKFKKNIEPYDIIIPSGKWYQINPDQYSFTAPMDEVIKWRITNRIKYEEEIQKKLIVEEKDGIKYKRMDIVQQSINQMEELMENNLFITDTLVLAINSELYLEPRFHDGSLIIPKEYEIAMSDGFHRYISMTDVKFLHPEWKFNPNFMLTFFTIEKTNRYIIQLDRKNHFKPDQIDARDKQKESNVLLDLLNESSKFHWKGKIVDTYDYYVLASRVLSKLYDLKDPRFSSEIRKSIEKNLNELIDQNDLYYHDIMREELAIYLCLIKFCGDFNKNFVDVVNSIDMDEVYEIVKFNKEPTAKQYYYLEEVVKNV